MATNRELARATTVRGLFDPQPFGPRWLREFDRYFNRDSAFTTAEGELETWVPEMEAFERNNRLTVRVDVPGLKKEELAVNVAEGVLTVEGERKHETEEKENHWYRRDRTYGRFHRTMTLPEGVNPKDVEAVFGNGVLEVTVPLRAAAPAAPHTVPVLEPHEKVPVAG
jgi:HSP20 family protein